MTHRRRLPFKRTAVAAAVLVAMEVHAVPPVVELSDLDGSNGFALNGIAAFDSSGASVNGAGDVNGDGFDDFIIGAIQFYGSGQSYVVFGSDAGFPASFALSALDGSNGFALNGVPALAGTGYSVSGAGDVNGDGLDDILIGAPDFYGGSYGPGQSYVVFGSDSGFPASLELSALDGTNGFALNGVVAGDWSGHSVSGTGDVNGDGLDDLLIGAPRADPSGYGSGQSYVVFGSDAGFPAAVELSALDGTNGFALNGIAVDDRAGTSVSGAGDVNGDGFDDLLIGAYRADPGGDSSGQSYLVFGTDAGFPASLELSVLDGSNGFALNGIAAGDASGSSVSGAGDVNGDGFDDLVIGATGADPDGRVAAGQSHVVFGSDAGFPASLELSALDGSNGFALNGIAASDASGFSVRGAGDVNGDGVNDLLIGAIQADPGGRANAGQSYVVFGSGAGFPASLELSALDGSNGFALNGIAADDSSGWSVSGAGDVNGDGFDDLLIGAPFAGPSGPFSGQSYVVFGGLSIPPPPGVGGSVLGMNPGNALCVNFTASARVRIPLSGAISWDCEASGLLVAPGDGLRMWVGGVADGSGSVGGVVTGLNAQAAVCRNRTTGQTVPVALAGASSWDCEAEGLVVSPSDFVFMGVGGVAE